jgi:hypothetical protein
LRGGGHRDLYDLGPGWPLRRRRSGFWREEYALNLRIKRYPKRMWR